MAAISKPNIKPSIAFFLLVSLAIMIGAYTHLIWDSFTHRHRWGTDLFPSLSNSYPILGQKIAIFSLFQHGSSVVGLPIILATALLWLKRQPTENNCLAPAYVASNSTCLLAVALVVLVSLQAVYQFALDQNLAIELRASQTATRSICVVVFAAIGYSAFIQIRTFHNELLAAREQENPNKQV